MEMMLLARMSPFQKTVSSLILVVGGLALAAVAFGDVMSVRGKTYFFSVPIPCKEYMALKRYTEENKFYERGNTAKKMEN